MIQLDDLIKGWGVCPSSRNQVVNLMLRNYQLFLSASSFSISLFLEAQPCAVTACFVLMDGLPFMCVFNLVSVIGLCPPGRHCKWDAPTLQSTLVSTRNNHAVINGRSRATCYIDFWSKGERAGQERGSRKWFPLCKGRDHFYFCDNICGLRKPDAQCIFFYLFYLFWD